MGDTPTAEELRVALEDLDTDAVFWFRSSDIVAAAAQTAQTYTLGGFEFGLAADGFGVTAKYRELQEYVVKTLTDGAGELEKLALALRDARDTLDATDRESGIDIGGAGGINPGGALGEAAGSIIRDLPGR